MTDRPGHGPQPVNMTRKTLLRTPDLLPSTATMIVTCNCEKVTLSIPDELPELQICRELRRRRARPACVSVANAAMPPNPLRPQQPCAPHIVQQLQQVL